MTADLATIHERPVELLQALLRFDTTNPPGNEVACVAYIDALLRAVGCAPTVLARDPARPNLLARLPGAGAAPPLLLYGHVDVVTTAGQRWRHPPFAGEIADGFVWGRGALDMKGGVAMLLAAFLRARAAGVTPPGDVILAILSDEEAGGDHGARWLVEEHAGRFAGVHHALGEFGGFALQIGGRTFYPIMVAEKQICQVRAAFRGPGGHGSLPARGGAMARLGRTLVRLDRRRLPVHVTPVVRRTIAAMAGALPAPAGPLLRTLLNPRLTDATLNLLGKRGEVFDPILHHTVNATIVRGGEAINVIPSAIALDLDGRLLPGYGPDDLLRELRGLAGRDAHFEVVAYEPGPPAPDLALFDTLGGILRAADPAGIPIPLLLAAVTDGRHFARLGIQTYGFTPMNLPAGFDFSSLVHAADERLPVAALNFGTDAVYEAIRRYRVA